MAKKKCDVYAYDMNEHKSYYFESYTECAKFFGILDSLVRQGIQKDPGYGSVKFTDLICTPKSNPTKKYIFSKIYLDEILGEHYVYMTKFGNVHPDESITNVKPDSSVQSKYESTNNSAHQSVDHKKSCSLDEVFESMKTTLDLIDASLGQLQCLPLEKQDAMKSYFLPLIYSKLDSYSLNLS